jgi:hypothetical protein
MNSSFNDELRTTIHCPEFCAARFKKNGDKCFNSVKYMFIFSGGEELFSCGIPYHMNNIKKLNCVDNDIKIYKRKSKKNQYFEYESTVEKITEYDICTLKEKINVTYNNWYVLRSLQVEKLHAINGLNQVTNTHRNPGSLVNFELLNNKLTKFISEIDDITRLEYRQNILSIFNLKFNEIYMNNMYYSLPFREHGECTICFENTDDENTCGSLSCGHVFHNECISKWFKQKTNSKNTHSCPNCRQEVNTKWYLYFKCKTFL